MSTANRRTHERFPFSSRLEVRCQRSASPARGVGPDDRAEATALDVSVGGFGFRSELPLAVGDLISVTLPQMGREWDLGFVDVDPRQPRTRLPEDPWLEIRAVVRHVSREAGAYVIGAERHLDSI